jgi:hypothetical protein
MGNIKKIGLYIFFMLLVFVTSTLTGCGSSMKGVSSQSTASSTRAHAPENKAADLEVPQGLNQSSPQVAGAQMQNDGASQTQAVSAVSPDSKIIKNGTMEMETKDFTSTVGSIMNKASECGGYVESSNITGTSINNQGTFQNRTANLKLRIPQKYFIQFVADAGKIGNVIRSSTSSENVTYQYYDTEAHIKALTTEEDRLLELLKKTGELKDILELEKELANVRYQIESLTSTLKKLDNLVDYSTVEVIINEVQKIQPSKKVPITLWDRISESFTESLKFMVSIFKGVLIGAAYAIPFAVLAALVFFLIKHFKLIKRFRKTDNSSEKDNNK